MEENFEWKTISCLDRALHQVQNSEQTLEIKLQEGMPDVGQVLNAWGQPVLRSKEWQEEQVQFSGGMMVWVLYESEDGLEVQWVQGWIPFQMRWELPDHTPEGILRLHCLTRFVDARSVSPRKIMVRAGVSALGEGCIRKEGDTWTPGEMPEDVQLLRRTYPMMLMTEVGEKTFQLDEELSLPPSAPEP